MLKIRCLNWDPEKIYHLSLNNQIFFRGEKNKKFFEILKKGEEADLKLLASQKTSYIKAQKIIENEIKKGNTPLFTTPNLCFALWIIFFYKGFAQRKLEEKYRFEPYKFVLAFVTKKVIWTNIIGENTLAKETLINLEDVKITYFLPEEEVILRWKNLEKFLKIDLKNLLKKLLNKENVVEPNLFSIGYDFLEEDFIWMEPLMSIPQYLNKALIFNKKKYYKELLFTFEKAFKKRFGG